MRTHTNSFFIGGNTPVLIIPKEVAEELEMDKSKKTFFKVLTEYHNKKKRIIYELIEHTNKKE